MEALPAPVTLSALLCVDPELVEKISRDLSLGRAHPLSPDKEPGIALLFLCGDDLDQIASKTNYPKDIIIATAIKYGWLEKAQQLKTGRDESVLVEIKADLHRMLVLATYASLKKKLGDVIAGRVDATAVPLIPTTMVGLEKLMAMGQPAAIPPAPAPGSTVVHANQVQINQTAVEQPKVIRDPDRAKKLRALRDEK